MSERRMIRMNDALYREICLLEDLLKLLDGAVYYHEELDEIYEVLNELYKHDLELMRNESD
jgi:hypothetical protein